MCNSGCVRALTGHEVRPPFQMAPICPPTALPWYCRDTSESLMSSTSPTLCPSPQLLPPILCSHHIEEQSGLAASYPSSCPTNTHRAMPPPLPPPPPPTHSILPPPSASSLPSPPASTPASQRCSGDGCTCPAFSKGSVSLTYCTCGHPIAWHGPSGRPSSLTVHTGTSRSGCSSPVSPAGSPITSPTASRGIPPPFLNAPIDQRRGSTVPPTLPSTLSSPTPPQPPAPPE